MVHSTHCHKLEPDFFSQSVILNRNGSIGPCSFHVPPEVYNLKCIGRTLRNEYQWPSPVSMGVSTMKNWTPCIPNSRRARNKDWQNEPPLRCSSNTELGSC